MRIHSRFVQQMQQETASDLDVRIEMEDAVAPVITGVMTGGDPDTLQTSFTVAEDCRRYNAVADFGATETSSVVRLV